MFRYMNSKRLKVLNLIVPALIGIFMISFAGYKASIASFTHDESTTYLNFVHLDFMDIISFQPANTNNHILNTLLMKYSEKMAGSSEFALRFPNLIFLMVYMVFTFLILKQSKRLLLIPGFVLMSFNPFLLDFFGLARGYGISIGCMLFALYFLVHYFKNHKKRDVVLFNLGALLASLANFTMLNFYVTGLFAFNLLLFLKTQTTENQRLSLRYFLRENTINFAALLISTTVLFEPVRKLGKYLTLDFGSKNGIGDTLTSQVYNTFYNTTISGTTESWLTGFIVLILCINFTLIAINLIHKNPRFIQTNKFLIAVGTITVLILAASIVQHYLLGYDYLKDRFALFFYPLIILNFVFLLNYLTNFKLKNTVYAVAFILIPLFTINLITNLNTRYYKDWKYDMDTKEMLLFLETELEKTNQPVKLGVNWIFEPTTNFYRATRKFDWLEPVSREGISGNEDYFYVLKKELPANAEVLFMPPNGETALYRN